MAKINFENIAVRGDKKHEIDNLRKKLSELGFFNVTYDEMMEILLQKNKKYTFSNDEISKILRQCRGLL